MRLLKYAYAHGALAILLVALTACSGGSGDSSNDGNGTLTLGIVDGPVEGAAQVVVAFTGIELKPDNGPPMDPIPMDESACDDFDAATGTCSINLLDLVGTNRRVVFSGAAGRSLSMGAPARERRAQCHGFLPDDAGRPDVFPLHTERFGDGAQDRERITVTAMAYRTARSTSTCASPSQSAGLSDPDQQCADNYVLKPAIRIVDSTEVGAVSERWTNPCSPPARAARWTRWGAIRTSPYVYDDATARRSLTTGRRRWRSAHFRVCRLERRRAGLHVRSGLPAGSAPTISA
jgi:hypothetical protein